MLLNGASGIPLGPPTRLALKVRPVFIGLLVVQFLMTLSRFFIMDLWGAMLTFMVVSMGCFVVSTGGGMDTTYCLYYGLMCLVNGIFDVILCVERCVHVKYALFELRAPVIFNVASVVFLISPAVELAGSALAGWVYADAQEAESRLLMAQPNYASAIAQRAAIREDLEAAARGRPPPPRPSEGFMPFQGRSHHL
mmetsp:Transcript_93776/g.201344  ORF Transcript_93776/g.201344 Transcript_93776/m.201344 type:complete len:195 (+) Transcript_93776:206-790(+)